MSDLKQDPDIAADIAQRIYEQELTKPNMAKSNIAYISDLEQEPNIAADVRKRIHEQTLTKPNDWQTIHHGLHV